MILEEGLGKMGGGGLGELVGRAGSDRKRRRGWVKRKEEEELGEMEGGAG